MKQRTIAEAAMEVLKEANEPMTAQEITQAILDKGLYEFNTKDQVGMVRRAIARWCEGYEKNLKIHPCLTLTTHDLTLPRHTAAQNQ